MATADTTAEKIKNHVAASPSYFEIEWKTGSTVH